MFRRIRSRNLIHVLQKRLSDRKALIFLDETLKEIATLTFKELDAKARVIAGYLQTEGLVGERVLLLFPTSIDFIVSFIGCLYAGVIPVPVACPPLEDFEKSQPLIYTIAKDANIAGILAKEKYHTALHQFIHTSLPQQKILVADPKQIDPAIQLHYQLLNFSEDEIAYLQYTSGSTASPKGVMIRHRNLTHNLKYTIKAWDYSRSSVTVNWAPHTHVYGLICGLLVPLYHGTPAVLLSPQVFIKQPVLWLKALTRYRGTHGGCPNFGYDYCVQEIKGKDLPALNLKRWRCAVNGGESVRYATLIQFTEKFKSCGFKLKHFNSAYGMSEATGLIAANKVGSAARCIHLNTDALKANQAIVDKKGISTRSVVSSGHLISGLKAVIVDPHQLTPLKCGNIGEVWLAGNSIASGYWQHEKASSEIFRLTLHGQADSFFRTGDLGFIHKGELYLTGRLKEILVLHGKKYYPQDLEMTVAQALASYAVANRRIVFSIGHEDNEQQEKFIFLQEVKEKFPVDQLDHVIHLIKQVIVTTHGVHLDVVLLVKENTIPKTASGKIQRKLCQQYYLDRKIHPITWNETKSVEVKTSTEHSHFKQDFLQWVAAVLNIPATDLQLTAPLSQYHIDSIQIIKLANVLNEKMNLTLTPAKLFEYATLNDFLMDIQKTKQPPSSRPPVSRPVSQPVGNDIAVIGMSGILPGANDLDMFWENLLARKEVITEIPSDRWRWQENENINKWGGFIQDIAQFDPGFFNITPREAELMDPQQRLLLQTVWKAIEDAGYPSSALSDSITGLFVGVFSHNYAELLQQHHITDAYMTTGITQSLLANRISYLLNLKGPSETIDTACSSSLVALHHAIRAMQNGDCTMAIVGGVNALLTPTAYASATLAGMLSEEGKCYTFDQRANGYVRSEGVIAIVLKPAKQAIADGDHIYGLVKGTAVNHGGHVSSITVPNPHAQADVIVAACKQAHVDATSISYVEAHGTGTSLGDPIEVNGLKKAFQLLNASSTGYCGIGAVKTHIGHLESAAGLAGVVKVLLAMQHQTLPGNLHFDTLNPYIELKNSPFYIVDRTRPWTPLTDKHNQEIVRRAGVSSFGFGGTNAHVILEEYDDEKIHPADSPVLILLSAKSEWSLAERIKQLHRFLQKQSVHPALAHLAFTLNVGRMHFNHRCALVVDSMSELMTTLQSIQEGVLAENVLKHTVDASKKHNRPIFQALFEQAMNELRQLSQTSPAYRQKLLVLADLYVEGFDIDWQWLPTKDKKRLSLPTYPFAKEYYWLPAPTKTLVQSLPANNDALIHLIAQLIKVDANAISPTATLTDLGFDSISFKELATLLEKQFNLTLTPALFFTYKTVQSLNDYLQSQGTPLTRSVQPIRSQTPIENTVEPIAIIGVQGLLPQSNDVEIFWQHLLSNHDLVTEIPSDRWRWQDYYGDAKAHADKTNSKWGAFIAGADYFDAGFFNLSSREANLMDPQQRLLMEVVWKTIEDAGYDPLSLSKGDVGIFAGVEFSEYQNLVYRSNTSFHGHVATGTSHALLANRISYFLNYHGPSEVIDTACSSSLVALHRAVNALRSKECAVAIASGVSIMLDPTTFVVTSQLGALSSDGRCKTFDQSANGYVKGEGVVAVLLKPLSEAFKDQDHIYAVIRQTAVNHGGKAQSLTAPDAGSQSQLLIKAYQQAAIDPATIQYIETHGTGTELGDPIEVEGLKLAFNTLMQRQTHQPSFCGLGAVKTNTGHLEPASGMAGLVKLIFALRDQVMPANLHFKSLNPFIRLDNSPFYIVQQNESWRALEDKHGHALPRRAGISSFGFGGTNAHCIVEESPERTALAAPEKPAFLLTLSVKQPQSLKQKMADLFAWLTQHASKTTLSSLAYTLNAGRSHFDYRAVFVVRSLEEFQDTLKAVIDSRITSRCLMNETVVRQKPNTQADQLYQTTMAALKERDPKNYEDKLFILAQLYLQQLTIDWEMLHAGESRQRQASLPVYPFIKQRYWFNLENQPAAKAMIAEPVVAVVTAPVAVPIATTTPSLVSYLKMIFAEKLKIQPEQISPDQTYEVIGVDSLIGLEITNRLEQDFGTLPKTLLYERNYLNDLAAYLQQKFPEKTASVLGVTQANEPIKEVTPSSELIHDTSTGTVDIAIVGIAGRYPKANTLEEFWDNLKMGRDCIGEVPDDRWKVEDYPVKVGDATKLFSYGGFLTDIDQFDPLFFNISPGDAALMDPQERLFLQSAWSTLEDAGYTRESLQRTVNNKVGVFAGVTYNFYPLLIAEEWQKGNRIPLDIQTFSIANRVSYFLNANGPSLVIDTACSSALAAIHLACESIAQGDCVMALAGGVNLTVHPAKYHFLGSYSFMSDAGRCASFAEGGAGYVPSEGVGCVLLKPLALAIRDHDRIYGVIKSSSMNHGGKTSGYTVPNPRAQADLIKSALEKAHINPRSISYIEAHGTGTALGDPIEVRGLQEAFEQYTNDKQFCAIGSVKSNIGHTESAAGVSQLTKVLLQMQHKQLAPSIHAEKLNPFIEFSSTPFVVQRTLADWITTENCPVRRAGISSFGAGGTNVHLIVEEYCAEQPVAYNNKPPYLFLLSAMNVDRLKEYAENMVSYLIHHPDPSSSWFNDVCYTLRVGREAMTARLAIVTSGYEDCLAKLKAFLTNPNQQLTDVWFNPTSQPNQTPSAQLSQWIAHNNVHQLAPAWIQGMNFPWQSLALSPTGKRVSLPLYPFAKRRCWVTSAPTPITATPTEKALTVDEWLYQTTWVPKKTQEQPREETMGDWLIFSDKALGFVMRDAVSKTSIDCFMSDEFKTSDQVIYLNPQRADHFEKCFEQLAARKNINLKGILYLWPLTHHFEDSQAEILFNCLKAVVKQSWQHKIKFYLVTRCAQPVIDSEDVNPYHHYLWSLTRIFAAECSQVDVTLVDLGSQMPFPLEAKMLTEELQIKKHGQENHLAYRNHERYVIRLLKLDSQKTQAWQPPRAALITGGLGALGYEVAVWLAKSGTKYLLLTGNTVLPPLNALSQTTSVELKEKMTLLIRLQNQGVTVRYVAVDVADKTKMASLIEETQTAWDTKITGVFHLAGVTTDNLTLANMSESVLKKVLSVKVQGAQVLHELFNTPDINCFVLFSSIASLPFFGMSGLSAYAMANEFLNGLAAKRAAAQLPSMSISWAAWSEKGMSHRYNHSQFLEAMGMSVISPAQGIQLLTHLMNHPVANVTVFKIDWEKFFQVNSEAKKHPFFTIFKEQFVKEAPTPSVIVHHNREEIQSLVTQLFEGVLKLNPGEVDAQVPYQNYGLDSINGIQFVAQLNTHFPDVVSPMDLYRYPTINQLIDYIASSIKVAAPAPSPQFESSGLSESELLQLLQNELAEVDHLM